MAGHHRAYVPAAGHDWLLPFYDPLQKLMGGDSARRELIEQARVSRGQRILDIGCGTGDLVVLVGRLHPDTEVVGLDPDPKALCRARRKAERGGVAVHFDQGFSDELPYPQGSFDRVFSSFMLHHLKPEEKQKTFQEVRRVLKPGGSFHALDFGGSAAREDGLVARLLHSAENLRDHFEGRIPALMHQAGLAESGEVGRRRTLFGRTAYYSGSAPSGDNAR